MARRFHSRKPRRSSNEGDYFTDAELQQIKPHKKMFDPSVLDAILHPVIPQLAVPTPPAPAPAPADLMHSFAMQPIPVPGLQNNNRNTKKHRLNSNNETKTKKSNIPHPIKHQRFSSVPPIPSGLPKPIEQSKPTSGFEWHEGKLINRGTGEVKSSSSFRHGKSGSHQSGRKYNSQVAKKEQHRRAHGH